MIDILIANNNSINAEGLKTILQSKLGHRVLGVVNSTEELMQQSKRYFPSIIVIDFSASAFGIEAIKRIKSIYKDVKILAITEAQSSKTIYTVLKNGVDSFLFDDCDKVEIIEAIAETNAGKQFYCPSVIDILSQSKDNEEVSLSEREIEIIRLIADGLTNKQIADQIFLSTHTVNTHRKNIMNKLGIKNTAGIVIYAVTENIVKT
jgi:DNA-binding NarL/FixJ family response regulator